MSDGSGDRTVVTNKKAFYDYHVLQQVEAGLALTGTEIKSVRAGRVSLGEGFVYIRGGEAMLMNVHIAEYVQGNRYNHDELRPRKLLLHRKELRRMIGQVEQKGLTLVPLDLHFRHGVAKVNLALVRGKKLHDKREDARRRDAEREIARDYRDH